jgi:hypothetical protein
LCGDPRIFDDLTKVPQVFRNPGGSPALQNERPIGCDGALHGDFFPTSSTDAEIVNLFEWHPTNPADERVAISAYQRICYGFRALRTVEVRPGLGIGHGLLNIDCSIMALPASRGSRS